MKKALLERRYNILKRFQPVTTLNEVIVVDGGSRDKSIYEAEKEGALVIKSLRKGRTAQMNDGASAAEERYCTSFTLIQFPPRPLHLISPKRYKMASPWLLPAAV